MRPTRAAKATGSRTELLSGRYSRVPLFGESQLNWRFTVATLRAFLQQLWMHKNNNAGMTKITDFLCMLQGFLSLLQDHTKNPNMVIKSNTLSWPKYINYNWTLKKNLKEEKSGHSQIWRLLIPWINRCLSVQKLHDLSSGGVSCVYPGVVSCLLWPCSWNKWFR